MEFIIENVVYHKHFSLSRRHTSFPRRFSEADPAGAAFVLGASHRGVSGHGLLPGKAKEGLIGVFVHLVLLRLPPRRPYSYYLKEALTEWETCDGFYSALNILLQPLAPVFISAYKSEVHTSQKKEGTNFFQ
uniref:Uncharacterized protein n=1 Tax=Myotis myotis TaxID=51298 RepID=A0A7J7TTR8_MYOMY|nr:hypothetical protein mMyoMyo1_008966 [Myotis myotis]